MTTIHAQVVSHGSIVLVTPKHGLAREWLEENTEGQWWGGGLVVEPRYIEGLLHGLNEAMEDHQ